MASDDGPRSSMCEGCGKSLFRTKKIHEQLKYCSTCYARLFKRRPCPQCAEIARLPIFDLKAVCQHCFSKQPCVRCHRVGRPVGRMTVYGPACNSCAHYFLPPQPCEICQVLSTRLVNMLVDGQIVKGCPRCARRDFETCVACGRNRRLILGADGRKLCRLCSTVGTTACSFCGINMPAGMGAKCTECYWEHTYRKRLAMDIEVFSSGWMRVEFERFGAWLPSRTHYKKAARSIHRFLLFFQEIDKHWPGWPSYADLLAYFGAEALRRMRLPMAWYTEINAVVVDVQAREMDSEHRRISIILASTEPGRKSEALNGYFRLLMSRVSIGRTSIRSARLALSTAARLLTDKCRGKDELPSTVKVSRFLSDAPGRMASVTGFIHYLNAECGSGIDLGRVRRQSKILEKRRLEKELFALLRQSRAGDDVETRWLVLGLKYFHGVSRLNTRDLTVAPDASGKGLRVSIGYRDYWLPSPYMTTP